MVISITRKVDELLSYPGIDKNSLLLRKNVWLGDIGITLAIFGMTFLGWLVDLPIIIWYGITLLAFCILNILLLLFIKKNEAWIHFISHTIIIWITFYFMILLGGLLNSAGLIFTGISILFMSVNYQNDRMTIALFVSYLLSLIIIAILQPGLTPPPEMTPEKNLLFFTVNFSWQAGYAVMLIINNINQKKKISEAKQAEADRLKELDELKTRFFTNITHEFRTPLTIILGLSDLVNRKPEEWLQQGTEKIKIHGRYLLSLVNQMLDLSRLDAGAMRLQNLQQDIITHLRYISDSLLSLAQARRIDLRFETGPDHFLMDYDPERLIQVVSNLLSNAIKYVQEGGWVLLSAHLSGENHPRMVIRITDNGPGIPADQLDLIFDRFYRIEGGEIPSEHGTGLGLSLTRELVKLMNGTITAESQPGIQTTFTVSLPVTNRAPLRNLMTVPQPDHTGSVHADAGNDHASSGEDTNGNDPGKPVLLIVEDNPDLVLYLTAVLEQEYHIISAANGKEGLIKVSTILPDIILSDVMMPGMDGITMLEMIKNDMHSSHIPVVLLTAKADIESRLGGLERGADAYLAKPFHEPELKIQLKNLIANRRRLRERYSSMGAFPETADRSIRIEDQFIMRIREIMEKHLGDESFGIQELCNEVNMSRAQLYRKFKSLTDKTVHEYLQSFRLFKARSLLEAGELNVTEVAYDVGFKSISHFSRVFTAEFGKNPSEFRKLRDNQATF